MNPDPSSLPVPGRGKNSLPATTARRGAGLQKLDRRLRAEEREHNEFLPAHLEILETPPSPHAMNFALVICAMFAVALGWSFLAHIDIYAEAAGRIQPDGRSKVVQPFQNSKVDAVFIRNGDVVSKGTPLLDLEATTANADYASSLAKLHTFEAQVARYNAAIDAIRTDNLDIEPTFPADIAPSIAGLERAAMRADLSQYKATKDSLTAQLSEKKATEDRYTQSVFARSRLQAVLKERAEMRQTLVDRSAGTRASVIDAMQQLEQANADLAYDQGQLTESRAAIVSLQRKISQLEKETWAKQTQALADADEKRASAKEDVVKASYQKAQMHLTSPIDGTVQQLAVTTVGQVVTAGQPLLVVVPSDGSIEVEALLPSRDMGFVFPGQDAVVKIDSFPFTRYGTIEGTVARVSKDAVDPREVNGSADAVSVAKGQSIGQVNGAQATQGLVFPVSIKLKKLSIEADGKSVPLTAGMTGSVEIRTGQRRVIDYLLSPIIETTSSAGHER